MFVSAVSGPLEQEYKKDFFRRYRRLIQINALGSLSLFLILCILIIVVLPAVDYIVLLIFAIVFLVLAALVGSFYIGMLFVVHVHLLRFISSQEAQPHIFHTLWLLNHFWPLLG